MKPRAIRKLSKRQISEKMKSHFRHDKYIQELKQKLMQYEIPLGVIYFEDLKSKKFQALTCQKFQINIFDKSNA